MSRMQFDATIESARGGGALVRLPSEAAALFGTRARFPVSVTFNGVPYQGSTMPMGDGTFCVGVRKDIQAQAGVAPGDVVHVVLERDDSERTVEVPAQLASALARDRAAKSFFDRLAYSHRRAYARWVGEAKKEETKARRAEQAVQMLKDGKTRAM